MKHPLSWIPSLYFAEALPYVAVMTISVIMYNRMGLSNGEVAFYTSWLYLPWVIKPFWGPVIDVLRTKRWWILAMQLLIGAGMTGVAFTLNGPGWLQWTLACFYLMAFSSATHDIAADGFYMLALSTHEQTLYVGWRSTFYRIATLFGSSALVGLAAVLETYTRRVPLSWSITFYLMAGVMLLLWLWHTAALPHETTARSHTATARSHETTAPTHETTAPTHETTAPTHETTAPTHDPKLRSQYMTILRDFFTRPQTLVAIVFMLLYRLPEAMLVKICPLFLLDENGMALSTGELAQAQGTVGMIGLTLGGIIGGTVAARHGLKAWLWPMVAAITLPDVVYVWMSYSPSMSFLTVNVCIFVEQLGYGFGFTAYMLYLMYYSQGRYQTAHYAFCTGLMALSMMIPGMFAGYLQEALGYRHFFLLVMALCIVTVVVSSLLRIDPQYGRKK